MSQSSQSSVSGVNIFQKYWATSLLALVIIVLIVGFLVGGDMRKFVWYNLVNLPLLGGAYLAGVIVAVVMKRQFTLAMGVTLCLSLLAIVPGALLLSIAPMAYPADISTTEPTLAIRVPTGEPMKALLGGDGVEGNAHARTPDMRWAYDLVIDPYVLRGARLANYGCFGVTVVAPVSGLVVQTENELPDNRPGERATDEPAGNHVVIEPAGGGYLIIGHLRSQSVTVTAGDRVIEGEPIGECGSSGSTVEPQVHVHYQRQHPAEVRQNYADGLPLYFRDHGGPAMPVGGVASEGGEILALGDVIQHRGR